MESDGDAAFEAHDPKSRCDIVTPCSTFGEIAEATASAFDSPDVTHGAVIAAAFGDVEVEIAKVVAGLWREDNPMRHGPPKPLHASHAAHEYPRKPHRLG